MAKALQIAVANYQEHMSERDFPVCFADKIEFDGWATMEELTVHTQPIRKFACRDCTTAYQTKMKSENRCCNPQLKLGRFAD